MADISFDDLIPQTAPAAGISFDDLIPQKSFWQKAGDVARDAAQREWTGIKELGASVPVLGHLVPRDEAMTQYEQEHPTVTAINRAGGNVAATAPLMAAAPVWAGIEGPLALRAGATALTQGSLAGADTLADTGDLGKALGNAELTGAAAGLMVPGFSALGSAAGWGAQRVGNAYSSLAQALSRGGQQAPSLSAAAVPKAPVIPSGAAWPVTENLMRDFQAAGMSRNEAFDAAISAMEKHQSDTNFGEHGMAHLPEGIVDLGKNLQGFGRSITSQPGEAQTLGNEFLGGRAGVDTENLVPVTSMNVRAIDAAKRALGFPDADLRQTVQEALAGQKAAAKPAYEAVRSNPTQFDVNPVLDQFEKDHADALLGNTWNAFKKASDLYRGEGRVSSDVTNLSRFDAAKKQVDDLISTAQRAGENNQVRLLTDLQKRMVEHADLSTAATPDDRTTSPYYLARSLWQGPQKLINAAQAGYEALKPDRSFEGAIASTPFASMTEPEQNFARIGAAQQLENMLGGKAYGEDTSRLFRQENVQNALREVFPSDERLAQFNRLQAREHVMQDTFNKAFRGSDTARILAGNQDAGQLSAFGRNIREIAHPAGIAWATLTEGLQQLGSMSEADRAAAARLIFQEGQPALDTLQALKARYGDNFMSKIRAAMESPGASGASTDALARALTQNQGRQ